MWGCEVGVQPEVDPLQGRKRILWRTWQCWPSGLGILASRTVSKYISVFQTTQCIYLVVAAWAGQELPKKINFNAAFLIINLCFVRVGFIFLDMEYKALDRLIPFNLWTLTVTSYLCSQSRIHTVLPTPGAVVSSSCPVTPLGTYMHYMRRPRWDSGKESAGQTQETHVRSQDGEGPLV